MSLQDPNLDLLQILWDHTLPLPPGPELPGTKGSPDPGWPIRVCPGTLASGPSEPRMVNLGGCAYTYVWVTRMLVCRAREREGQSVREGEASRHPGRGRRGSVGNTGKIGATWRWPGAQLGPALGSECPLGLATNPALAAVCGFQLCAAPRLVCEVPLLGSEHPSAAFLSSA